jgi:CubicO group peptidase (beta-lactamase class C family)
MRSLLGQAWLGALPLGLAAGLSIAGAAAADAAMDAKIEALVPDLEAYVEKAMADFDVPGVAIGIVSGDRLVWGRGFGSTRKEGGTPVDTATVFQIGSASKGFLATTLAIGVDRGLFAWDDRVVDRHPGFQMMDPWVSQEFRLLDLLAQRSGLRPYAHDMLGFLGADHARLIRSLRFAAPITSFRTAFAYTNITHLVAGDIVAEGFGAADWAGVVTKEIFEPLGMARTSLTAEAIEAADNATSGYRYDPAGSVEVPFTPLFPYAFEGAGAINSTVEDLVPWLRLHLGDGALDGTPIVSAANLAATKTARIGITEDWAYAMGWLLQSTPNGRITWHNGGTTSYGAYLGTLLDKDVGIVVLSNQSNVGMPDAVGEWALDRLLGNPEVDHAAARLAAAQAAAAGAAAAFARPAAPTAPPPLDGLAGDWTNPALGAATLAVDGEGLVLSLTETGANLALAPWDGDSFTFGYVREGRFAAIAENLGPGPLGFVQFLVDKTGARTGFTMTFQEDGQTLGFTRP